MPLPLLQKNNPPPSPPLSLFFTAFPREKLIEVLSQHKDCALLAANEYQKLEWQYLLRNSPIDNDILQIDQYETGMKYSFLIMPSLPSLSSLNILAHLSQNLYILVTLNSFIDLKSKEYMVWERITNDPHILKIKQECPFKLLSKKEKLSYNEQVFISMIKSSGFGLTIDQLHSIATGQAKKEAHYPGYAALRGTGKREILDSLQKLINSGRLVWHNKKLKASGLEKG